MVNIKPRVLVVLVLLALLLMIPGGVVADDETPPEGDQPQEVFVEIEGAEIHPELANVGNAFPVQGVLTNASGTPLSGEYSITFRLYDVATGGTALCQDVNTVTVTNGLFSSAVWGNCPDDINGQQLFLGIEVGSGGEMTPRQQIYAVPYAFSLRPGAVISGSLNAALVHIENTNASGRALRAYASSTTGTNYGVVGASSSPAGFGGYFYNNGGGIGLQGSSDTGVAIRAAGTGVIQSSALSYLWISGSNIRPYRQADSTIIDMDTVGGAIVRRGTVAGNKNVMLPITITGPLYGQNVKVTGLDLYYRASTEFDGITAVVFRRQKGVCGTTDCYDTILSSGTDLVCDTTVSPNGCSHHYALTANNVITADTGILYLTLEMTFGGASGWVEFGGARLTLEHD